MLAFIIILLILWAGLSIAGFVIKGLFWLAVIGVVLFVATLAFGAAKKAFRRGGSTTAR